MITVSLCMVLKNKESMMKRCLDSVSDIFDEIIILDLGSSDKTKEIAKQYTQKVYDFFWDDDFSQARNESFSKATMDYCMWMNAEEVLLEPDRKALIHFKEMIPPITDVVMMRNNVMYDKEKSPTFTFYNVRMVRRDANLEWNGYVHEEIEPFGYILFSDITVTNQRNSSEMSCENLKIFNRKQKLGIQFAAKDVFYYARELYEHKYYEQAGTQFEKFLNFSDGWIEHKIEACRLLSYCYREIGEKEKCLCALFQSLEYDLPRAELCCEIGTCFLEQKAYRQAIYWYEQALNTPREDEKCGVVIPDCYGYIPAIQLCVCYDSIGYYVIARKYNDLAGKFRPDSEEYQYNLNYFLSLEK